MDLSAYTTFEDIRAALGVSDEEVDDAVLALDVYSDGLYEELIEVSSGLVATYDSIKNKAEEDRSDKESRVFKLTRLFATYSVAKQLGAALPMFSPRSISDGKASMSRFPGEPYRDVLKGVLEQYELYRGRLIRALDDLSSSLIEASPISILRVANPVYDPVTGE